MGKKEKKNNSAYSIKSQNVDIDSLLDENVVKVNKLARYFFIMLMMIVLLSTVLNALGIYKLKYYSAAEMAVVGTMLCVIAIIADNIRTLDPKLQKFINLASLALFCGWANYIYGYNAPYILAVETIMGAMYFEYRTTVLNYISAQIAFATSTYASAMYGRMLDNNHVDVADGTVLVCEGGLKTTLINAGMRNTAYMKKMMLNDVLPKFITSLLILLVALILTKLGYEMIAHQAKVAAENAKAATELHLASQLQQNALPLFDSINGKYNFELSGGMKAAREVGGDFYDFFMLDETHLALVIGDVSDKGVPAALFMMSSMEKIRSALRPDILPNKQFEIVNNMLCENNPNNMFVTTWLGIVNIETGRMLSVNAGHENPILIRSGEKPEEQKTRHGTMLGVFPDRHYQSEEAFIKSGDVLLVYTDGVTEARNEDGELYGMNRVLSGLEAAVVGKDFSAKDVTDALTDQLEEYVEKAEQSDDITMMAFKML